MAHNLNKTPVNMHSIKEINESDFVPAVFSEGEDIGPVVVSGGLCGSCAFVPSEDEKVANKLDDERLYAEAFGACGDTHEGDLEIMDKIIANVLPEEGVELVDSTKDFMEAFSKHSPQFYEKFERLENNIHYGYGAPIRYLEHLLKTYPEEGMRDWVSVLDEKRGLVNSIMRCKTLKWEFSHAVSMMQFGDQRCRDYVLAATCLAHVASLRKKDSDFSQKAFKHLYSLYTESEPGTFYTIEDFSRQFTGGTLVYKFHGWFDLPTVPVEIGMDMDVATMINDTIEKLTNQLKLLNIQHTVKHQFDLGDGTLQILLGGALVLAANWTDICTPAYRSAVTAAGILMLGTSAPVRGFIKDSLEYFKRSGSSVSGYVAHANPPSESEGVLVKYILTPFARIVQYIIFGEAAPPEMVWKGLSSMEYLLKVDTILTKSVDRLMDLFVFVMDKAIKFGVPGANFLHPYADLREYEELARNTVSGLESGELQPTKELLDRMYVLVTKIKAIQVVTNPNSVKGRYVVNVMKVVKDLEALLKSANLAQGMRPETKAFVFVGPPGGGKTTVMNLLLPTVAAAVCSPEIRDIVVESPELITASININSNFADTVKPWTKIIVTDEMFVTKDSKGVENKQSDLLIKMCSCTPYNIEKAAVEEKGNVWCNASVFMGCSNLTKLDRTTLESYTEPGAIVRRIRSYMPVPRRMFCENPNAPVHKRIMKKNKSELPNPDPSQWHFYRWDYGLGRLMVGADGKQLPALNYVDVLKQIEEDIASAKTSFEKVSAKATDLAKAFSKARSEGKDFSYEDAYPGADAIRGAEEAKMPEVVLPVEDMPVELLEGALESFVDPDAVGEVDVGASFHSLEYAAASLNMLITLAIAAYGFKKTMEVVRRRNAMAPERPVEGVTRAAARANFDRFYADSVEYVADRNNFFRMFLVGAISRDSRPNMIHLTEEERERLDIFLQDYPEVLSLLKAMLAMCHGMSFGKRIFMAAFASIEETYMPPNNSTVAHRAMYYDNFVYNNTNQAACNYIETHRDIIFAESTKLNFVWDFINVNWLYMAATTISLALPAYRLWKSYSTIKPPPVVEAISPTDVVVDATGETDEEAKELVENIASDLGIDRTTMDSVLLGYDAKLVPHSEYNHATLVKYRVVAARSKARQRRKANVRKAKAERMAAAATESKEEVPLISVEHHSEVSTDIISSHLRTSVKLIGIKGQAYTGTIIGLKGKFALVNRHFIRTWAKFGNPIIVVQCNGTGAPDNETSFSQLKFHELSNADKKDIDEGLKGDLMIVEFPEYFPSFKDITGSFVSKDHAFVDRTKIWLPLRKQKTRVSDVVVVTNGVRAPYTMAITDEDLGVVKEANFLKIETPTMPGDCGTPVYIHKNGTLKIAGVVAYGNAADFCCAPIVTVEDVAWVGVTSHGLVVGKEGNVVMLDDTTVEDDRVKIKNMVPIAVWNGPVAHSVSNKCTTPLKGCFDSIAPSDPIAPARLRKFNSDDGVIDPLVKACAVYCSNTTYIPSLKLAQVADVLVRHYSVNGVVPVCAPPNFDKFEEAVEDAVYGVQGIYHAMPSDTAVGPSLEEAVPKNWTGPKRKYFLGEGRDSKGPGWQLLMDSMIRTRDAMDGDVIFPTRLELKDELRSIKKVRNGQTRAYFVAPMELQIWIRMAYIGITQAFVNAGIGAGTAIGANPATDWTSLVYFLRLFGNILDSDFSGYDGSITVQLILTALDVLDKLYPTSDPVLLKARKCIRRNLAYAWVIVERMVYVMFGNNSGNGLTIFINCIITHIVTLFCTTMYVANCGFSTDMDGNAFKVTDEDMETLEFDPASVFRKMFMCSMGDDLIASLGGELANFTTQDFARLASTLGFKVTNSDKTDPNANPRSNLALQDVSFLKRTFVEDDFKGYIAPLDLQSIRKQCEWSELRILENKPEVFKATIQEAIMELALHGQDTFEQYVHCIRMAIVKSQQPELLPEMMDYNVCKSIMVGRSKGMAYIPSEVRFSDVSFQMEAPTTTTIGAEVEASSVVTTPSLVSPYEVKGTAIEDFFEKPWLVYTGTWDTTQDFGDEVLPLAGGLSTDNLLTLNPIWVSKWKGFSLVRCDIEFTLEVNTTPFHSGELLMHFTPLEQAFTAVNTNFAKMHNYNLTTRSMQQSVIYNCRDTGVHMTIPYIAPTEYYVLEETPGSTSMPKYDRGALHVCVQSPLSIGTTGATVVTYALYAKFSNVELVAPVVPHANKVKSGKKSGKLTDEKELATTSKGTISSALDVAATISGALTAVPMLAPLTGPAEIFLRGMSGIASFFGFDKPVNNLGTTVTVHQPMRYSATCDGVANAYPLGLMCNNKVRLLDTKSITGEDEMAFNFLKRKAAFVNHYVWDAADPPATVLTLATPGQFKNTAGDLLVSPWNMYHQSNYVGTTGSVTTQTGPPIWYLSNLFTLWRGSITVLLRFVKTDYHSGRVQITYTPRPDAPSPTLVTSQYAMRTIVDIRDTTEVSFTLPYLAATPYLDMNESMGSFSVRVLTELRAPETCSQEVKILMFVSGGPDMELQLPGTRGIRSNLWPFSPQMDKPASTAGSVPLVPGTALSRPETSFTAAEECIGEYFSSVRQLLQRTMAIYSRTVVSGADNVNVWPFFISCGRYNAGAIDSPSYGGDVYSYIASMYTLYRGSMKVFMDGTSGSVPHACINPALVMAGRNCVTGDAIIRNGWALNTSPTGYPIDWRTSSTVMQPTGHASMENNSNVWTSRQVHVPYYCKTACSLAIPISNDYIPRVGAALEVSVPYGAVSIYNLIGTNPISRSIGEDFQLMYFVGCPPVTVGGIVGSG